MGYFYGGNKAIDPYQKYGDGLEMVKPFSSNTESDIPHPKDIIIFYTHSSNQDPFVVFQACGYYGFSWTYKSNLLSLPGILSICGCGGQLGGAINRGNRNSAIQTCNQQAACPFPIIAAPEGTRSSTSLVAPELKKGMFYVRNRL